MRTDADTRWATLDAAAIGNFIEIFVRGGRNLPVRTPSTASLAATPGAGGLLWCLVRPHSPVWAEADAERPRRHL